MRTLLQRRLRDWLPVAIWLGLLALESTDMMSSDHTGGILYTVVTKIFGHIDPARFEVFHHLLRKAGHFLGYGIFCLLLFHALIDSYRGTLGRWAGVAITVTFLVASLDELHQSFLPSRGGSLRDVVLDTFGAACLLLLAVWYLRRRARRLQAAEELRAAD